MRNKIKKNSAIWVGISQKKEVKNLSKNSLSGSMIFEIEKRVKKIESYKTNLVDFAPVDKTGKLCYPTEKEIDQNFNILWKNIVNKNPKIIFLLGGMVATAFERNLKIKIKKWNDYEYYTTSFDNLKLVAVHHPSYIKVYKKKEAEKYVQSIVDVILRFNM
jgi:uracil-DNA glycosylase family 4